MYISTMEKKTQAGSKIAEITGKVVALLEPLSSEDRQKVINASLTLLGETSTGGRASGGGSGVNGQGRDLNGKGDHNLEGISAKAQNWMKQNQLTMAQLERLFDVGADGTTVIASEVPGKNGKEKTINAYVLQGVSRFLASGESAFDDQHARKVCEHFGCYDRANHARTLNEKGNLFTGAKGTGWKITAPGLQRGADLIKQLTKEG
jgi:hypothetical protein